MNNLQFNPLALTELEKWIAPQDLEERLQEISYKYTQYILADSETINDKDNPALEELWLIRFLQKNLLVHK